MQATNEGSMCEQQEKGLGDILSEALEKRQKDIDKMDANYIRFVNVLREIAGLSDARADEAPGIARCALEEAGEQ
jgi:hypothetical protein